MNARSEPVMALAPDELFPPTPTFLAAFPTQPRTPQATAMASNRLFQRRSNRKSGE